MSLVRSAGLQKFRQVVESLGGDAVGCARRVGLPVEALDTDELLVEDSKLAAVLEVAAADLGCPDLGLRVGQAQDLGLLGPLAVAIQHSPSVADALECTSRYMFVHARDQSVSLGEDPDGDRGVVALRYAFPGVRPLPQATDMTVLFLHRTVLFLAGGQYGLKSVDLPHDPIAPRQRYEEAFGARVRFGRSAAVLRLPSSLLSRTLEGVDATVRGLALAFLSRQSPEAGKAVTSQVHALLDQSLGTGSTELADVARVLAVHPRTLQRQLAAEGTSFGSVLDSVRRARARSYLTTTTMPFAQVSNLVGFAEQAVLTRCARRWWGRTPSQLRREVRNRD
ncbi:AraC family transcriptional regulator [Couchioplanes caeruleus]|uniref:Transcriptional regulator n=2 Tax=Couchioplanes caeruleus TaxID=56438 RepID=A0A1K0FCD1_9ACTN|nr:AraC family transcriptional regulator [Couchioplanes caeruleus]OJF10503.1 transcriptional regulator [Couchioplanes caeruleus subsp. caeruleus]ROP28588.1 AraC-like DNA-binding protein [Couchioplanes caeruleus]